MALLFNVLFSLWVMVVAYLSVSAAISAGQIKQWWATTIAMLVVPIVMTAILVVLFQNHLVGAAFAIGLIIGGGLMFAAGAVRGWRSAGVVPVSLRVVGWSMMASPMMISMVLFILVPIPLLLAFFIQPRWKRTGVTAATSP